MAKRAGTLVALTLVLAAEALAASKSQPLPPMTAEKWREDIDYFARELPKRHMNAFHAITRENFEAAVTNLRTKAGTAGDDAMIVGLMQIAAMVGDGHTNVHLPTSVHQFPIGVVFLDGAYRIVRGTGSGADLVGGRLVEIDGTSVGDAVARIHTIISQAESDVLMEAFTPQWFSIAEVLHGLGITKSASAANIKAVFDDGTERAADVTAMDVVAPQVQWRLAAASVPLYRQRVPETFWFTWLEEPRAVYVNWRKYDDLRGKSREMWSFVDSHPVQKIIIDLRQNGGGDFNVGRKYLVDELARRPRLRAYVITGGKTFSAALKNAIDFREVAHATLVGETIGERPNSYSENDEMTLPNSRIVMSYSTRFYKFLPDEGLVKPDREIKPTWADWVAGRDPVLDWILNN